MSNTGVSFRELDFNNASEVGFCYKSWLGSYKNHAGECPYSIYRQTYQAYIDRLVKRDECSIVLAVHPEHTDQIFGFICVERSLPMVHYLYVKEDFRRTGIGEDLLEFVSQGNDTGEFGYTYNTALGRKFLRKRGGKYRPKFIRNELP